MDAVSGEREYTEMIVYIWKNEEQTGPFDLNEVLRCLEEGTYLSQDFCWIETWSEWRPLSELISERGSFDIVPIPPLQNPTTSNPKKRNKRRFFSSLFSTRDVVKHTIRFGKFGTHAVKSEWFTEADNGMLSASLLLYMSMYFYAGEPRVVEATVREIATHLEEERAPDQLTEDIFYAIRSVFNLIEKEAVDGIFKYGQPFRLDGFESFEQKRDIIKTISTNSLKSGNIWVATISVGFGLDVVVLPLAIGILYNFIFEQLEDPGRVQLKNAVVDMCLLGAKGQCKTLNGSRTAVNSIIHKIWGLHPL